MEEKVKISNKRILLASCFMFLFLSMVICLLTLLNHREPNRTELRNGWSVSVNEEQHTNVNLGEFHFPAVGTGDTITLKRTLPTQEENATVLHFFTRSSAITVSLDGKEIYRYGMERLNDNRLVGNGNHFITLASDSLGKELTIVMYVNEPKAFTHIKYPSLSNGDALDNNLVSDTFFNLCASIFLLIFGICIVAISIFMMTLYPGFSQLFYTGLFSICIGLWAFCNKGSIQLISPNLALNQCLESFSLYVGSIPMILFIKSLRPKDRRRITVPKILLTVNLTLLFFTIVLHGFNLVHYVVLLPVYHALYLLIVGYIVISCIQHIKKGNRQEKILLTGICILALTSAYDIFMFRLSRYVHAITDDYIGATALGGVLFVICMIMSYGGRIYREMCAKMEKEALMHLAYCDNLTNLSNRARFMEHIEELEDHKRVYSIISFDLNNLKLTNDRLGHASGDLLLRIFGKVLQETFSQNGTVARMGGDEFSILIPHNQKVFIDKLMTDYEKNLKKENEKGYPFQISAAFGIASNEENGHLNFPEVFALADKRMYSVKGDMKRSASRS